MSKQPIIYVLLSGGIDSATALGLASEQEDAEVRAVSMDYGQRHSIELTSARRVADYYSVPHEVINLPFVGRTMLTDESIRVPDISYAEIEGVSPTYVPFRNGMMLSRLAAHISERHLDPTMKDHSDYNRDCQIWWGAHAEDAAGGAYPDCSVEFIGAMACAIYIGTYHKVRVIAPFDTMFKHEIIKRGSEIGVPYDITWSCYKGGATHCGTCATCLARKGAFSLAGIEDPTIYA
jgi:7-cyano-7-deazaguanine synthase